jgi:hypothetical protein
LKGENEPSFGKVVEIAGALDMTLADLVAGLGKVIPKTGPAKPTFAAQVRAAVRDEMEKLKAAHSIADDADELAQRLRNLSPEERATLGGVLDQLAGGAGSSKRPGRRRA